MLPPSPHVLRAEREAEIKKESPSRQIIIALQERVLIPLASTPPEKMNRALQLAIDNLNAGLLWLMENEKVNFMKGQK